MAKDVLIFNRSLAMNFNKLYYFNKTFKDAKFKLKKIISDLFLFVNVKAFHQLKRGAVWSKFPLDIRS